MVRVPAVLSILEEIKVDIKSPPGDLVTMTLAALQSAQTRLPQNWMIWVGFVLTYHHIQDSVIDNLRPFTDGRHYLWDPATMLEGA